MILPFHFLQIAKAYNELHQQMQLITIRIQNPSGAILQKGLIHNTYQILVQSTRSPRALSIEGCRKFLTENESTAVDHPALQWQNAPLGHLLQTIRLLNLTTRRPSASGWEFWPGCMSSLCSTASMNCVRSWICREGASTLLQPYFQQVGLRKVSGRTAATDTESAVNLWRQ